MPFRDSDIPALLADMGVPVTIGAVAGIGLIDLQDQVLASDRGGGEVVIPMTTLIVRTSDFPALAIDQAVVIGAANYTVRERLRQGDGALTKVLLGAN